MLISRFLGSKQQKMEMCDESRRPPQRIWRCTSKSGDIQIWDRMNITHDPLLRQRQFRFGRDARTRITVMVVDEQDIKEDKYEGKCF